jgi:hypothetical protein
VSCAGLCAPCCTHPGPSFYDDDDLLLFISDLKSSEVSFQKNFNRY